MDQQPIITPVIPSGPVSGVETQIPSVVAATQRKNSLMIAVFLVFMALVAGVVCHKPTPKDAAVSLPKVDNAPAGPALPPPMAYARPVLPVRMMLARDSGMMSGGDSLLDVRRKSPVVIFNKAPSQSGVAASGGTPDSGLQAAFGGSSGGQDNSSSLSGVPLPSGFNPSMAQSAHATALGERDYILAQGKLLDAVLETAINSDHPGMLRALISHDVYGDTGRTVLLPRGSRLVGQYDSAVAKGQDRVFVIWQRAIRPDGVDIQLGSAGTDTLGRTGIDGDVNNHFFTMFGAAALLSVIGASASTLGVNAQDQNNSLSQYRYSLTQGFASAAGTVLGQFVQIKPTITVKQGVEIKVFVGRDLYFDPSLIGGNGIQVIQ